MSGALRTAAVCTAVVVGVCVTVGFLAGAAYGVIALVSLGDWFIPLGVAAGIAAVFVVLLAATVVSELE